MLLAFLFKLWWLVSCCEGHLMQAASSRAGDQ